jgi:hypothetical protein
LVASFRIFSESAAPSLPRRATGSSEPVLGWLVAVARGPIMRAIAVYVTWGVIALDPDTPMGRA